MPTSPVDVVSAFVAAVNQGDDQAVADILDESFVDNTPNPGQDPGRGAFINQKLVTLRTAFPDLVLTIEDELVDGDRVAFRWTIRATHLGPFVGQAPTGVSVVFGGINIEEIRDGRIVSHWSVYDSFDLLRQVGVLAPV